VVDESTIPVHAIAAILSSSGKSLFKSMKGNKNERSYYQDVLPSEKVLEDSAELLKKMGFDVVASGRFSLIFASEKEHFENTFKVKLQTAELPIIAYSKEPTFTYYTTEDTIIVPKEMSLCVERVVLEPPCQYDASPTPPFLSYYHLTPDDVAKHLRATDIHSEYTGSKIHVAMVDSGFYMHKYYAARDYDIDVQPAVRWDLYAPWEFDLQRDEYGHGTAIASNLLAVAPGIKMTMVKCFSNYGVVPAMGNVNFNISGFYTALSELNPPPHIITCSWHAGTLEMYEDVTSGESNAAYSIMNAEIWGAKDRGITIVFSCGNGGKIGWPGCNPNNISVGGAYIDDVGRWWASSYASSGPTSWYDNRWVPDICGIVGQSPCGRLIVMPVEPGCRLDVSRTGSGQEIYVPESCMDQTEIDDGWAVFSGTSSAAPQVAGVMALLYEKLLQAGVSMDYSFVIIARRQLILNARDIIQGESSTHFSAVSGHDKATGWGVVDAVKALQVYIPPDG